MATLREHLPREFFQSYMDTRAATMLDVEVECEHFGHTSKRWPGTEKWVFCWWKLVDGRCVGFNENPSRGWSFPVFGKKQLGVVND